MNKIIEITTPTCSVCKMLKPMIEKVMASYSNIEFIVYDHENPDIKYFLETYKIKSVPAFFFVKEGETIDIHFGAISLPELKKKVENLINYEV